MEARPVELCARRGQGASRGPASWRGSGDARVGWQFATWVLGSKSFGAGGVTDARGFCGQPNVWCGKGSCAGKGSMWVLLHPMCAA